MFYVYCCKQKFFLKEQIKKKINSFLSEINSLNYLVINDNDLNNIVRNSLEVSLFGDKKVVIIENASFLLEENNIGEKDIDTLNKFLITKNHNIMIFLLIYEDKINFNKKISKAACNNLEVFSFSLLDKGNWLKYVQKIISEKKINIETDAILELAERTFNDYSKLFNEVEKISLCERKISLMDITNLVSESIEKNIFDLLNHLLDGNVSLSLQTFYNLFKSNNFDNNFPVFVLNIIAKQIRFFYLCIFLFNNGNNIVEIANKLRANKIRVKIVIGKAKKIKNIFNILNDIYDVDYKIKSNQIDKTLAIELFIINFCKKYLD